MKSSTQTLRSSNAILEEFRSLVADAEKVIGGSGSEDSAEVMDALRRRYEIVQTRLSGVFARTRARVFAGATFTDDTIRGNPYSFIAAAAGVGVLLGVLLSRRRTS